MGESSYPARWLLSSFCWNVVRSPRCLAAGTGRAGEATVVSQNILLPRHFPPSRPWRAAPAPKARPSPVPAHPAPRNMIRLRCCLAAIAAGCVLPALSRLTQLVHPAFCRRCSNSEERPDGRRRGAINVRGDHTYVGIVGIGLKRATLRDHDRRIISRKDRTYHVRVDSDPADFVNWTQC